MLTVAMLLIITTIAFGQTITIKKAELDKRIVRQNDDDVLVEGVLKLEIEVYNNTKETVYLFRRNVEPFLEGRPFQVIQSQPSIEKFSEECGGRFVNNQPPSSYRFEKFNMENDIIAIKPKGKETMTLSRYVDEGLCPAIGKKIELKMVYNMVRSNFSKEQSLKEIKNKEEALVILKNQEKINQENTVLKEQTSLIRELSDSIKDLENSINFLKNRIVEYNQLSQYKFTTEKLESNTVVAND